MSVINFTVQYDQLASTNPSALIPMFGTVAFNVVTLDERPVMARTLSPRPAGLKFRSFIGHIDTDGRLKTTPGGSAGVRLVANDPKFNLERLVYRVDFNLKTALGEPVHVEGGLFEAPSSDVTINLASVLKSAEIFRRGYSIARTGSFVNAQGQLILFREDGFQLPPITMSDFPNPVAAAFAMTFGR